jgi:hypothetical protein
MRQSVSDERHYGGKDWVRNVQKAGEGIEPFDLGARILGA